MNLATVAAVGIRYRGNGTGKFEIWTESGKVRGILNAIPGELWQESQCVLNFTQKEKELYLVYKGTEPFAEMVRETPGGDMEQGFEFKGKQSTHKKTGSGSH